MVDETRPKGTDSGEAEGVASAFEALRNAIDKRGAATEGELKLIRQGVEALFDQVEALQARPDLAQDMAELRQTSVALAERLKAMESMPTIKGGVQAFERAGADLLRASVKTLEQKAQRFDSAAITLERITGYVHDRRALWRQVVTAGGVGLLAGFAILLFSPRFLSFEVATNLASVVIGKSRWDAGSELMRSSDPKKWKFMVNSAELAQANTEVLERCREAADKSGKTIKCAVKVFPGLKPILY